MAERQQLVRCAPHRVWQVLANGESYASWVVGTQEIVHVDETWPAVGSALSFQVGIGPLHFKDSCVVRICEPEHRLELEAKAESVGSARIAFRLLPWGGETLVILDEHPLKGIGARLQGPLSETMLHLRNRRILSNLARVAAEDRGTREPAQPSGLRRTQKSARDHDRP